MNETPETEEMGHPLARPWPETIARLFEGKESITIEELYSKLAKMGVTEAQIDGVIEMLENQPGIRFEDYVVYHSENDQAEARRVSVPHETKGTK